MPELNYENVPMGEVRMECSLIGDIEKAELLDSLHIAKGVHQKLVDKYKYWVGGFGDSLRMSHQRAIMRIEKLEQTIRDIPTPND